MRASFLTPVREGEGPPRTRIQPCSPWRYVASLSEKFERSCLLKLSDFDLQYGDRARDWKLIDGTVQSPDVAPTSPNYSPLCSKEHTTKS